MPFFVLFFCFPSLLVFAVVVVVVVNSINDLRKRFEAPIESNRWDHPLFKVNMGKEGIAADTDTATTASVVESVATVFKGIKLDTTATSTAASTASAVIASTTTEGMGETSASTSSLSSFKPKSSWRPKKTKATESSSSSNSTGASTGTDSNCAASPDDTSIAQTAAGTDASSAIGTGAETRGDDKQLWFSGAMMTRSADLLDSFSTAEDAVAKIHAYFTSAAPSRQSASTVSRLNGSADALYELDSISKKIIQHIVAHQADNVEGTPIKFLEFDREIMLRRHTAQAELQRYRAQFIKMNGKTAPESSTIGAEFIDFLALHL